MIVSLIPHPSQPEGPLTSLGVHLMRQGERLWVRFVAEGAVQDVDWPGPAEPGRTDELWKHSCFEVFITTTGGYREFNLSPSSQWASYRFTGYREDMADDNAIAAIDPLDLAEDMLALEAHLDLPSPVGKLGLTAVIEARDGSKSYWALAHPSDKPDFHHPDSFVLDLP
jgi:hypothetical protein